jgi:two-component system cell cycle response regulator
MTPDVSSQVRRLCRQNAALRAEVARLRALRALAERDSLTGLWNRRTFDARLREELSRSERAGPGRRFSVLVVDINAFKAVNDSHGHPVGDTLLKWTGEFLTAHLRAHDVPCRTGGDEFAVLLPDVSSDGAAHLVARLRRELSLANAGRAIPVELSLGTATWAGAGSNAADLVAEADRQMYVDKRRQKADVAVPARPRGSQRARKVGGAEADRRVAVGGPR